MPTMDSRAPVAICSRAWRMNSAHSMRPLQRCRDLDACQRLQEMDGIGPLNATALVAALGHGHDVRHGRQVAAWLGLVPRQYGSGGKTRFAGISKRGDS